MTHEQDPFDKASAELTRADSEQAQLSEQFKENLNGLYSAALMRGGDPDDRIHYINIASRLIDIQTTKDTSQQRDKERELLAEFAAYTPPQTVIDVTLAYFPMDPLGEEDAGLVAEKIAERDVALDKINAIDSQINDIIDDLEKKTSETIEFNEIEEDYILRFIHNYYALLYKTPEKEVPIRRANLLESVDTIARRADFQPAVQHIVVTLLNDSEPS